MSDLYELSLLSSNRQLLSQYLFHMGDLVGHRATHVEVSFWSKSLLGTSLTWYESRYRWKLAFLLAEYLPCLNPSRTWRIPDFFVLPGTRCNKLIPGLKPLRNRRFQDCNLFCIVCITGSLYIHLRLTMY